MSCITEQLAILRRIDIECLGPRPQGFSPFARMRWDRKRRAIGQRYYEAARDAAINEGMLTPGYERALREGWL